MKPVKASRRSFRLSDGYDPVDLLLYAAGHKRGAELLFQSGGHLLDSAAHLGHLAVELLLKAILLHRTGLFTDSHDLVELARQVEDGGVRLEFNNEVELAFFSFAQYAGVRYPNPKNPQQVGSMDADLLGILWSHLDTRVPTDLRARYVATPAYEKGGRIFMSKPKADAT